VQIRARHIIFFILFAISSIKAIAQSIDSSVILKNKSGKTNLSKYLDTKKWQALFPNRYNLSNSKQDFYSFKSFITAAKKFPEFLNTGDASTQKRELAAFLANIAQETSGGWTEAPGGYYVWGLYYLEEQGCENGCSNYSDTNNKIYPAVKGRSYHGRGPKQLTWNYNYGQFSLAYFGNKDTLLNDPGVLSKDPVLAFASAIWFWMTIQPPKPSCHDIMTGKWVPTANDTLNGRMPGFGATVNVINGGIECGKQANEKTQYRYEYYKYFCNYLHVAPGDNIECATQKPFNIR